MKVKYSKSYAAKRARINRIPQMGKQMMDAYTKKDAVEAIQTFQDGLESDSFNLKRLRPGTISSKSRKGQPDTPLIGDGRSKKNSYINLFRIVRTKLGWRVRPRSATHWSGKVKLSTLFAIHENGATIKNRYGAFKIPARPAWKRAQKRFLRAKAARDPSKEVAAALRYYVKTGNKGRVSDFIRRVDKESRKYERSN